MNQQQLALAIQLNNEATFADFCWGANNLLQAQLESTLNHEGERLLYLWGAKGCGKSHVLQACCHAMSRLKPTSYLPLQTLKEWGPEVIEDISDQALIAIDDINAIAGDLAWEEAIFHLYNRVRDGEQTRLLISGNTPPAQIALQLPDLSSRLGWSLVFQIQELDDHNKINTLKWHAQKRGFELSDSVGQFLLNRCARNMHDLQTLLDRLDEASLIAQRKITIPFVKRVLEI